MKTKIAALTEVAEALRGEYIERDGAFVLKVEGEIPELVEMKNNLTEFRDNNIKLMKEQAAIQNQLKAFEGIDPTDHRMLVKKLEELEKKGGVKDPADIEARIRSAVQEALEPVNKKLAVEETHRKEAEHKLALSALEGKLRDVGAKLKVEERAMPDFLTRATKVFGVDGVAREGEKLLYSKEKVTDPLSMEEWGKNLLVDAPHLFTPSRGGGAAPGVGAGGQRTISAADPLELGRHAKEIAEGKIIVVPAQ